ncbi:hypothetical protein B2G71_06620 [Novosphingobium sp. PC22D]|uniref:phytanoyl-CoA dioxygenase family protein n=1 Tax=Novosphingobium sp. PC22D TaxID=1962403 RepID=UPI000BF08034|nr:phytanoyl-CoA dioxygenase family protein [Novosphingobium sp. PC22D]PEQ13964.1 hypothetical protein B2G71_06620 [Novosphingobium sp. PC22D]
MPRTATTKAPSVRCRDVTAREVCHYIEQGWAFLPRLLCAEAVGALRAMACARMGEDGQGNAVAPIDQPFFNPEATEGPDHPLLGPIIRAIGASARRLQDRRPGVGVRYFGDVFAAKLPTARETRHPGAGATYCHQDFTNWAVDRSGGMTFWIALEDLAPESGTMAFHSGSHRLGALGHYDAYEEGRDLLDDYPELAERCPAQGPFAYRAGDATVHSVMMAHSAGANLTDRPRWAWLVMTNPADVRWTGAPPQAYDTSAMRHLQRLDDETRFPLIG